MAPRIRKGIRRPTSKRATRAWLRMAETWPRRGAGASRKSWQGAWKSGRFYGMEQWIDLAWDVRERAYAPYSGFQVGAVVVGVGGEVFCGCNVENLSYGLTNCAERVAVGAAVAAGVREIASVIVVADTETPISPCGACRQVLAEFGDPEIWLVSRGDRVRYRLSDLLPRASAGILETPPSR